MRDLFRGATHIRFDDKVKINVIRGDHVQVFPKGATVEKAPKKPADAPQPTREHGKVLDWLNNMPPPPQITPAPGPETPQENTYPYVVFWIDKDASLRALEGDARFKGSAAIRLMIINAPERKYVGYLYQISSGDPNDANIKSQYQVFCVRRGLPPEVREQGLLPDMCVAVSSSNVVEDTRHRRPLQPSTTLPWAGCYHASFDIVPITINSTHQATLSKNLTTAPGKPCPVLSEKEVERHGGIIASDLKHRAKLPGKPKQPKESNEQGAATSRSPVPRVGTIQRQSWALITVNVSFSFDEDSKRDICLDPSDLIRLQSDLVTEVAKLGVREFKGLVGPGNLSQP